jgi:DNA-binding transcriptional regulator YdaS (Cro superfamily)
VSELTFGIALMSMRVAPNWPSVEKLLAATLRSAFNQSIPIRVIIACHEAPRIDEALDGRVTIRQVDFDIPRFRWEMEIDRMRKAEVLGAALRAQGAGWMFLLDADDLVSRDLGKAIVESGAKAVAVKRGYRLDARTGQYQSLGKLWGKCGSCAAVRWDASELPVAPLADNPPLFHEFCEARHYNLPQFFSDRDWNWKFLEAPLVAYVVNHGSNNSEFSTTQSWKWEIYFKLRQWKQWTPALDELFGVSPQIRTQGVYTGPNLFSTAFRG